MPMPLSRSYDGDYVTISPLILWNNKNGIWNIGTASNGLITEAKYTFSSFRTRPVLYISSNITLAGIGTSSDPYEIVS